MHARRRSSIGAKKTNWMKKQNTFLNKMGVKSDERAWAAKVGPESLRGVPDSQRMLSIIDCAWTARLAYKNCLGNDSMVVENYFANISQSHDWKSWHTGLRSMCTGTLWYSFEMDRVVDPRIEHFALLGHDIRRTQVDDARVAADLTGNAMSLCQLGTVMMAVVLEGRLPHFSAVWCRVIQQVLPRFRKVNQFIANLSNGFASLSTYRFASS